MSARWNPNLFFDLSGSTLKKKRPSFIGDLLWWNDKTEYRSPFWSSAWEQIVFGADVGPEKEHDVVNDYTILLDTLGVADHLRQAVFYGTAANILKKAGVKVDEA